MSSLKTVGKAVPRTEGVDKISGAAKYIDDIGFPGMIYGATVRSTIPRGKIESVTLDPAFDWSGFTVVDHRDIPGKNLVAMINAMPSRDRFADQFRRLSNTGRPARR